LLILAVAINVVFAVAVVVASTVILTFAMKGSSQFVAPIDLNIELIY